MAAEDYMLPCLNKSVLGVECFGCGSQRAFLMVLDGKFAEAFQLFPAIYPMVLLLGFAIVSIIDKKRNYATILIAMGILTTATMVISYFYRHYF